MSLGTLQFNKYICTEFPPITTQPTKPSKIVCLINDQLQFKSYTTKYFKPANCKFVDLNEIKVDLY